MQVRLATFQGKQMTAYNLLMNEILAKYSQQTISVRHSSRNVVKEITQYKLENIKTQQKNQQF